MVAGEVDRRHSAAADLALEGVVAECGYLYACHDCVRLCGIISQKSGLAGGFAIGARGLLAPFADWEFPDQWPRCVWSISNGSCRKRSEEHTSELQSQSNLVCR